MAIAGIFAGAFASLILEEIWEKAKNEIVKKPATKIFEHSVRKINDRKMLENIKMEDFLQLCDQLKYPESREVIENTYKSLSFTEKGKYQLFVDFKNIFSGQEKDLRILFEEFLEIFLREVVENSRDTDWKYWVWKQLKERGERKILLECLEEALYFDVREAKWFRGSPFWIDFEENKIYKRKEIDIVRDKLERENIQIIYGDAASGKSVVVKYIGYEYCKEPKPVFLINMKTDSLEWYKEDIVKLLDWDGLLIIKDAHLAFHDVDWVIRKATGRRLRILISTRPIKEKIIPREFSKLEILRRNYLLVIDDFDVLVKNSKISNGDIEKLLLLILFVNHSSRVLILSRLGFTFGDEKTSNLIRVVELNELSLQSVRLLLEKFGIRNYDMVTKIYKEIGGNPLILEYFVQMGRTRSIEQLLRDVSPFKRKIQRMDIE